MPRWGEGDRVVYYQPGIDGILASWSGRRGPRDGDEIEVTITSAREEDRTSYYETDKGVLLTDSDILRAA